MREFFFLFFSFRSEVREDEAYLDYLQTSSLPSSPFFLSSNTSCTPFPSIPITLIFSAYSSPIAGFFTHCCYEWMVGEGGEEKRWKEKGRGREDAKGVGEGKRGRTGMRENGMRKPVAVIIVLFSFTSIFLIFHAISFPSIKSAFHTLSSRPVPSRPVLFHYPFFLEPSRLLYLSSYLITPHLSHFLSFPFLLLFHPTPPPPTHQPTHSRSPSALLSPTPASSHSRFDTRDSSISADGWSSLTSFLYGLYIVHLFDFFPRLWEGSEGVWKQRFLGGTGDRMFRLVGGDSMGCGWGGGGSVLLYCFWNS